MDCSLGPKTIMTDTEEMILCEYIVNMADIGFFQSGQHESGIEDRPIQKWCNSWLQGFLIQHKLSVPLSHARAHSVMNEVLKIFFTKLGCIFARLNLLSKPMKV